MTDTHYVAVFDPESCDLCRLPANKIDTSNYERVPVPKGKRQFDIYISNDLEKYSSKGNGSNYAVVTRTTDDTGGKSHLARLYYSRLGIASDLQRLVSSKHRWLYIGAMPP